MGEVTPKFGTELLLVTMVLLTCMSILCYSDPGFFNSLALSRMCEDRSIEHHILERKEEEDVDIRTSFKKKCI